MSSAPLGAPATLAPIDFTTLNGFGDNCAPAFAAFHRAAVAASKGQPSLRPALNPEPLLAEVFASVLALPEQVTSAVARDVFLQHFTPYRITEPAFFTGYYEPIVDGALRPSADHTAPLLARPTDLRTFAAEEPRPSWAACLSAARQLPDGTLAPYPDRAAIETAAVDGAYRPLVWLRDWVEVFLVQVQGSARVRLADGTVLRLTYAGRNGHPYTSIGRLLVESGAVTRDAMSLDALKSWLRANGQAPGEDGRMLMQRNASYIFFDTASDASATGPTGGAGRPLTPLVSIAVDRSRWCYGLPFWVDATLPWTGEASTPLRRLMIAEDTGSAIVGPARVDLFMGSGAAAGRLAGGIRHPGTLTVLLPSPHRRGRP